MESETDTLKTWYDAQIDILKEWYHTLAENDSGWQDALAEEDSLKVYNALAAEGSLIVGLPELAPSEDFLKVKNPLTDARKSELLNKLLHADKLTLELISEGAKGRTALHVAARRGNVKLVKRILEMAENGTHGGPGGDQGTRSSSTYLKLLLSAKDSVYDLDALAMAFVNGNKEIVNLLTCESKPSDISRNAKDDDALQRITESIFSKRDVISQRNILQLYSKDRDFNFLDMCEYLFHFTFSTWSGENDHLIDPLRTDLFNSLSNESVKPRGRSPGETSCQTSVREYLPFTLKDGQGRTPVHVAVDSKKVDKFLDCIGALGTDETLVHNYPNDVYLNTLDSVGRTPLYRAAAKGDGFAVKRFLKYKRTDVSAKVKYSAHQWGADLHDLSRRNGFQCDDVFWEESEIGEHCPTEISSTVLHVAIIHRHKDIAKSLLSDPSRAKILLGDLSEDSPLRERDLSEHSPSRTSTQKLDLSCIRRITFPVGTDATAINHRDCSVNAMHLSVLIDDIRFFEALLKEPKINFPRLYWGEVLLLAAAMGNHYTVKALLDGGQDPLSLTDKFGNTALHHAVRGSYVKFQPHLVDFVCCEHVLLWRTENTKRAGNDADKEETWKIKRYNLRRGCVKALLNAGMNVWKRNEDKVEARPGPDAPEEFVKWWYDEVTEATKRAQEKVNAAANGITITATLVATASYVGPYTPPLGYIDSSVQLNILAVRIFVVCNSLSFYAALAAIIYALLPSLPLPEESVFVELKRTRLLVAISLAFLLAAIVCVLVTFAASYIAVTPDHGLSHHSLVLGTIIVGGFFCFLGITRFLERWMNVLLTLSDDDAYKFKFYEMFVNLDEIHSIFKKIGKWIGSHKTNPQSKNLGARYV